ncbi:anti-sigma factor domain-containing protein [Alicyclobacillus mali]|uniref:Anti-sigma factor domain-containing protein n=1 Tax=Alicyclobacillus mali (ex Roth et al. 2021) TaxID=1123961 RepID=A0ABS0F6I8_9BACL|nr:anti-sigma factor domain-containing protein [Alicyclobacillus mali (ex Roth et al. 2021)]MBF8378856.1 anti-sigma factor domain-containing protein [Alicyclobacillus mali (ex Roth et al. 2021)]MCL6489235.1 anti-sigma factor domain-containing protein [Alicyclobacillus mali (ex Roth et al. 2021)]
MSVRVRGRAVVVELRGERALVLTDDGAFMEMAARPSMSVGDVIDISARQVRGGWMRAWVRRRVALGAAAACALCAALGGGALAVAGWGSRPHALVSVDANAEWSLAVDRNMRVVSATAYNAVGQEVLARVPVKGEPLAQAVRSLVRELAAEGQMPRNDSVVVASTSLDGGDSGSLMTQAVASAVQGATRGEGNVYSMALSPSVWNQAVANHVAPAQYASYLLAQEVGVRVHLKDLSSANVQTVVAQAHDLDTALQGLNTGNYDEVASIVQAALNQSLNSRSEPRYNG